MSPIAKSGNSMLMIYFDLNKMELPDPKMEGILLIVQFDFFVKFLTSFDPKN